jgi:PAS domain-containing protein
MTGTLLLAAAMLVAVGALVVLWFRLRALRFEVAALRSAPVATDELANHAASTSAEWLALPVRGAQDAMWDWDLVTEKIRFSSRWREMVGMPAEEVIASSEEWWSRVHRRHRRDGFPAPGRLHPAPNRDRT